MNKYKLLLFVVTIIVLINVLLLGYFILGKESGPRERIMPREIIIKKLHFDASQIKAYELIIQEHQKAIRNLDDAIRFQKNELYGLLRSKTTNKKIADSLIHNISQIQIEIEKTHFNHFIEIRKICNEKQLKDYNALTEELSQIFSHPKRPKKE